MIAQGLTLILNYSAGNTYGLNVVLGALDAGAPRPGLRISCADSWPELITAARRALAQQRRLLVGWSFHSVDFSAAAAELRRFKKRLAGEDVLHIAGGVHASARPEQALQAGFDFVVRGEGEITLPRFLQAVLDGVGLEAVPGLSFLKCGKVVSNRASTPSDLNQFPPFALKHKRFNPIEITRGCIYACKFCQTAFLFKARYRHRTVENICQYVQFMKELGLLDIRFITPSCLSYGSADETVRLDKIEELLSSVRRVLGKTGRIFFGTFPSEVRPEQVTPAALKLLKSYVANSNLVIGAQSGSDRLLAACHRGHTVEAIVGAVTFCREAGFFPNVDFIFGLPGETPADGQATLKLIERLTGLGARIHGHAFLPLPGTPYEHEKPGQIDARTLRHLGRLTATGKLYGQWKQQIHIARDLTAPVLKSQILKSGAHFEISNLQI